MLVDQSQFPIFILILGLTLVNVLILILSNSWPVQNPVQQLKLISVDLKDKYVRT